jgi:hypothetical protein
MNVVNPIITIIFMVCGIAGFDVVSSLHVTTRRGPEGNIRSITPKPRIFAGLQVEGNLTALGALSARETGWEYLTMGYRVELNYFFSLCDIALFLKAIRF